MLDGLTKAGKSVLLRYIIPAVLKYHPMTANLKIFSFYKDLEKVIHKLKDTATLQIVEEALKTDLANFAADTLKMPIVTPYSLDSMLLAIQKFAIRNNFYVIYMWDEVQFLLRYDWGTMWKNVISNAEHANTFHFSTGSGMALAWDAFYKMPVGGHTIFTKLITLHLPFVGDSTGIFHALKELKCTYPNMPPEVLHLALQECPHSVTGICYYASETAKCATVTLSTFSTAHVLAGGYGQGGGEGSERQVQG